MKQYERKNNSNYYLDSNLWFCCRWFLQFIKLVDMSAKEKAKELIDKYYKLAESIEWTDKQTSEKAEKFNDELGTDVLKYWNELSKQSALIAVDEIIQEMNSVMLPNPFKQYWNEVKQEIEKL